MPDAVFIGPAVDRFSVKKNRCQAANNCYQERNFKFHSHNKNTNQLCDILTRYPGIEYTQLVY